MTRDVPSFRPATERVLEARPATERRRLGQYFTPRLVRQRLLDRVELLPGMTVLDPGAGTGELLLDVLEREPRCRVEGWDVDPGMVRVCREEHGLRRVDHRDALAGPWDARFDLVIGNPPYYEVRGRPELTERFARVVSGRPNAFAMFVQAALESLRPAGRLAFVVPPSMNNGAYFAALRSFVLEQASIEHLEVLDDPRLFDGAQQSVMLVVLRKRPGRDDFVYWADLGGARRMPIFTADPARLRSLTRGRSRLVDLGYVARTGRCVWNQRRADLRSRRVRGSVPLIWAHNIVGDRVVLGAPTAKPRPRYVVERRPDRGPAIAVNRIVGSVGGARLRSGVLARDFEFVGENHVNVVRGSSSAPSEVGAPIEAVSAALRSDEAMEAARLLTGNTQISATELTYLIPLRID